MIVDRALTPTMPEMQWDRPLFEGAQRQSYSPFEVLPAVLSARQCERVIDLGLAKCPEVAEVEELEGRTLSRDVRRSRVAWLAPDDSTEWLYRKLAKAVTSVNRRYGFDLTGFVEDAQFTVYEAPGDFYSWHQDGLDGSLADRKLAIVIQLSDPGSYVGGELQFFEVVESYDREELVEFSAQTAMRGSAIVFPAFEQHRVLPVVEGTRYSLVAWAAGPPFR